MSKLPTEIIADILSRLPPKPLCRFKCVAKPWNSLINSPIFIKLHLNQSLISQNPNLITSNYSLSTATITSTNPNNLQFSDLKHPVNQPPVHILGYCNGVFCISDRFKKTLFFYNPVTKSHRLIPPVPTNVPGYINNLWENYIPLSDQTIDHMLVFGFGYDESSDDYKLFRFVRCYGDSGRSDKEVRLFSLRNNSWKSVNDDVINYHYQKMDGVFVNGVLCFLVCDNDGKYMIKCLDLGTEKFSVFNMFEYDEDESFDQTKFVMAELGGCFCVMANYLYVDYCVNYGWYIAGSDFWVMKEYGKKESWVRVFSIGNNVGIGCLSHIRPVVYSKDGTKILLQCDEFYGTKLCWFDWGSSKVEWIETSAFPWNKEEPSDTYGFVGSVVSFGTDKVNSKPKGKSVLPKNINKKNMDGFLSTGFKLRL